MTPLPTIRQFIELSPEQRAELEVSLTREAGAHRQQADRIERRLDLFNDLNVQLETEEL